MNEQTVQFTLLVRERRTGSHLLDDFALHNRSTDMATPRVIGLLKTVLQQMYASGAALIVERDGRRSVVAHVGEDAIDIAVDAQEIDDAFRRDISVVDSGLERLEDARLTKTGLRFLASVRFAVIGISGVVCVVGHPSRRVNLAQQYVLRTLATEIGEQIELQVLRTNTRASDERLRLIESVVTNANDAILITEAEPVEEPGPRIRFVNAAFTRITGYELEEVVGKTPRILQGPNTDASARHRIAAALKAWQPIEIELLNYRKDGTPFWVELSIVPVANARGWYTHWVSVQRDITDRRAAEEASMRVRIAEARSEALAHRAFHDDLTGLRNRAFFMDRLALALSPTPSGQTSPVALLFLDLDRFKIVNDSLGHAVGDQLLIEVSRRLQGCARAHDTIARMGGDEFTVLLDGATSLNDAIAAATRILDALADPITLEGHEIATNASIGIRYVETRECLPADILRDADTAMYRAKRGGGARYVVFDASMHATALAALHAESAFLAALEKREFVLHYQPLTDMRDGSPHGFEALVRWEHPERGLVMPDAFIAMAEETGTIVALGTWVLVEACRQLAVWREQGCDITKISMSINVSARQLYETDFLATLRQACMENGLPPQAIQLEITERVLLEHSESVGQLLEEIREFGTRIALDDFGTGFSSLAYLQRFPIDVLKIDRSFVGRIDVEPVTMEIVRTIVSLARALKMRVVAEGIENARQRDLVVDAGCFIGQGYLFDRPLTPDAARNVLEGIAPTRLSASRTG